MKKTIKFKYATKTFETDLAGFIEAVSFKESSSNLSLPLNHTDNIIAAKNINGSGYMGLFQWGEEALYDLGYYLGDYGISYKDLAGVDKNSELSKRWQSQFDSHNWVGRWSGKRGINSKSDFLNSPAIQYEIIKEWISHLCRQIRNNNLNEYFGKTIQGVEVTESGAIAGMHLVGIGGLGAFLGIPKFQGSKQIDGNGTHISKYIEMFNHFDLENCCQRKIYIGLTDAEKNALANKEVIVVSRYDGKYVSGETRVKLKSDEQGNLPVIVRHPNTEIKILADGKESNSIVQKANEKQRATLSDFPISSYAATLETESTPQPKPQTNKTPQELRSEQSSPSLPTEEKTTSVPKDVNFDIQIVEDDTGKAISNMNFFLTYKGNIKKHTADNRGTKKGIIAEEGQDIEVSVEGSGYKQVIHHFKADAGLKNQTLKVRLPVHSFSISVTQDGQRVADTLFSIFYRGREIPKRTNASGMVTVKMLTGFVFGFGIKGKNLISSRVEKSVATKGFIVNASAVKAARLSEAAEEQRKKQQQAETARLQQQQKEIAEKKEKQAQEESNKAKTEADKNNQARQNNSYTQNGGRPITTVSRQAPVTSDTTNYIVYYDGTIHRKNRMATGFAAYFYVDENGIQNYIGKSRIYISKKWRRKGVVGDGNAYLVNIREVFGDIGVKPRSQWSRKDKTIDISIYNDTTEQHRYWMSTVAFAAYIGVVCKLNMKHARYSGFSTENGSPGKSVSHINGLVGDIGYVRVDRDHSIGVNFNMSQYDHVATLELVNTLTTFGWGKTTTMLSEYYPSSLITKFGLSKGYILPHCKHLSEPRHHNHLHMQGLQARAE